MLNKERKNIGRKNLGVTHENDPKQKKKGLINKSPLCMPSKEWMTKKSRETE
jgi:hypothetical protein